MTPNCDFSRLGLAKLRRGSGVMTKTTAKAALILTRVLLTAFAAAVLTGAFALAGAYTALLGDTDVDFDFFVIEPRKYSTKIVDKNGAQVGAFKGDEDRENIDFLKIPAHVRNAFIAIEDERFYAHNGIDIRGMIRAGREVFLRGNLQGASTITQQLIKMNITKVTHNSLESKLKEQFIAVKYEEFLEEKLGSKQAAKDYILGVYLNSIPMHHGLYGLRTAASYYFGKEVESLTVSEAAVLAGITNNPSKYAPDIKPDNNKERRKLILDKMLELGFITESEYETAEADNVYARVGAFLTHFDDPEAVHTFYEDQIFEQLAADLQDIGYDKTTAVNLIYNGGLTIETAQDFSMQAIVDEAYADDANFPAKDYEIDVLYEAVIRNKITGQVRNVADKKTVKTEDDALSYVEAAREGNLGLNDAVLFDQYQLTPEPQSAFVVMDYYTGRVLALAGGRGEKWANRAFNRATKATRSPGSTFKVLASYAPALDLGLITPATVIDDTPFLVGTYAPKNWYKTGFRGLSAVRQGITNSMNVIAVKNLVNTGIDKSFDYLAAFGFTTLVGEANAFGLTDKGPSLALGGMTNGVTQAELCAAYGAIANGGLYNKPVYYTKVFDIYGDLLIDNTPKPRRVLKETTAYLLTDMMKGVLTDQGATGGKARFSDVKMPIAGKTGTSSDTNDLIFVGYTPYLAASCWFGFDIQKPIEGANGDHMLLWRKIMEPIHANLPYKEFNVPAGVVSAQVCRYSGLLPIEGVCDCDPRGSAVKTEIFDAQNTSKTYCDRHAAYRVCTVSEMAAGEFCPEETVETRVGILRDAESAGKANDSVYEVPRGLPVCDVHTPRGQAQTDVPLGEIYFDPFGDKQNADVLPKNTPDGIVVPGGAAVPQAPAAPEYTPPALPPVPEFDFGDIFRR